MKREWPIILAVLFLILGAGLLSAWLDLHPLATIAVVVLAGLVVPLLQFVAAVVQTVVAEREFQRQFAASEAARAAKDRAAAKEPPEARHQG